MCCTPPLRWLIVLSHPAITVLSTGYRPLGSCSRAAGWSAATSCFGPSADMVAPLEPPLGHSRKPAAHSVAAMPTWDASCSSTLCDERLIGSICREYLDHIVIE